MAQSFPYSSPFALPASFYSSPVDASLTYMNPNVNMRSPGEVGAALAQVQQAYEMAKFKVGGPAFQASCPPGMVRDSSNSCKYPHPQPDRCH